MVRLLNSVKVDLPTLRHLHNPFSGSKKSLVKDYLPSLFVRTSIPWLDRIHEWRISDPWSPATYFTNDDGTMVDLLVSFACIDSDKLLENAKGQWTVKDAQTLSHQHNSPQFHSHIFGRFLVNLITDDLHGTILHLMDERIFHDGTHLFWSIFHCVHCNAASFIDNIISDYKEDLQKYRNFLRTQLMLICLNCSESDDPPDLITPIFQQLWR